MPLSLETAQTLALGPFNPHIITPGWLVENKVCEDAEVEVRFVPLVQGVAFSFKDVQWQIDFRHLMVASRKSDCGELVARVVGHLKHTPVRAVGNNFHYACDKENWGGSPLPMLGAENAAAWGLDKVEQTRWACVFHEDDARVEVTVANEEQGMAVLFNFHRVTSGADETCKAARQFLSDRKRSEDLLGRLFGQGVTK